MITAKPLAIFADLTGTIEKWVAYLDDYSFEMLCRQPQPDFWSLGQVYVHLINDTAYNINQAKAVLKDTDNREKPMHADARMMLSNNTFPDRQLENPANAGLRQPISKEELLYGLRSILQEVKDITTTTDLSQATGKTEHPAFGYFTALAWLQWAAMHMRHHFRQKIRIDSILFTGK